MASICLFGNHERGIRVYEALRLGVRHDIQSVVEVADKDRRQLHWARDFGEYVRNSPGSAVVLRGDEEGLNKLRKIFNTAPPDYIILAGYPDIVPWDILKMAKKCALNTHAGQLPQMRGPHPMNWALLLGKPKVHFTVHIAEETVDSGPIVRESSHLTLATDRFPDLLEKSLDDFPRLVVEAIDRLEGGKFTPIPQDEKKAHYYGRRRPGDGFVRWEHSAQRIYTMVRALAWPGPMVYFMSYMSDGRNKPFWINRASINYQFTGVPGSVMRLHKHYAIIACGKDALAIWDLWDENGNVFEDLREVIGSSRLV